MGILVRSGPLSDSRVQAALREWYVPVAIDMGCFGFDHIPTGLHYSPEPASGEQLSLLDTIQSQREMRQGIWIVTPEGNVIHGYYGTMAEPLLERLQEAVARWDDRPERPDPLPEWLIDSLSASLEDETPNTIRFGVHGRMDDGLSYEPFRDTADFPAEQWSALLPETLEVGTAFELPAEILKTLAARFYTGEVRCGIRPEEIQRVSAALTVRELTDDTVTADWDGTVAIEGAANFGHRGTRQYQATLTGEVQWDRELRAIRSVQLICDGTWQEELPEGERPGGWGNIYPTGGGPLVLSPPLRLLFLVEYPDGR